MIRVLIGKHSLIIILSLRFMMKNIIRTKTERTNFFVDHWLIDTSIINWHVCCIFIKALRNQHAVYVLSYSLVYNDLLNFPSTPFIPNHHLFQNRQWSTPEINLITVFLHLHGIISNLNAEGSADESLLHICIVIDHLHGL